MKNLNEISKKQYELQKLVGFPIDSIRESDMNQLGEVYIFKAIEELIELRKEFPSVMNKWSKKQKVTDKKRILEELSDVMFFLMNFCISFRIKPEELLEEMGNIQDVNFTKIKERMMDYLNEDILKVPNCTAGIGSGNINPKFIFVGQNPADGITKGYKFWSNPEDGSSKILLPILEELGISQDCYFTNLVKVTTTDNQEPDESTTAFWKEYFNREIEILSANCKPIIITLGQWANNMVDQEHLSIAHPSYILRGGMTTQEYADQIKETLAHLN